MLLYREKRIALKVKVRKNSRFLPITVKVGYKDDLDSVFKSAWYFAWKELEKDESLMDYKGEVILDMIDFWVTKTVHDVLRYDFVFAIELPNKQIGEEQA